MIAVTPKPMDDRVGATEHQVFVAREEQLRQLDDLLHQALRGRGQIIFVSGKAGAGKSWLLAHFLAHVQQLYPEPLTCYSECRGTPMVGNPFRPFDDLLSEIEQEACKRNKPLRWRRRLQERYRALVGRQKTEWGGLLGEIVGELLTGPLIPLIKIALTVLDVITGNKEESTDDRNSFRQRLDHLESNARRWPLVLAMDNFHRADDKSCALLEDILIRISDLPILLIIALRPDDLSLDSPLYSLWNEMTARRGIPEIQLDELMENENDQRRFVDAYLDAAYCPNHFDLHFRQKVVELTEGLPLFVSELLSFYEQQGYISKRDGSWVQVREIDRRLPDRVEKFIRQTRWNAIGNEDQLRLQVASVEGEVFTLQIVADAISESPRELGERFDGELGQRQKLVRPVTSIRLADHTYPRYGFWHSFYHQVAYKQLSPAARKQWHGRVGKAKKALWGAVWQEIAVELAKHFEESEDWDEALACYEAILHDWAGLVSSGQLAQVTLKCAEMLQKMGRTEAALWRYQEAEGLAVQADDPIQRRTALSGQAWTQFEMENYAEAERLFRSVLSFEASLEEPSGSEVGEKWLPVSRRLHFGLGIAQIAVGKQEESMAALAKALAPDDPETNDRLDENDLREARQWLRRLREQHPDTPGITEALRLVSFELGEIT